MAKQTDSGTNKNSPTRASRKSGTRRHSIVSKLNKDSYQELHDSPTVIRGLTDEPEQTTGQSTALFPNLKSRDHLGLILNDRRKLAQTIMATDKNSNAFLRSSVDSPRKNFMKGINTFNLPTERFVNNKMRKSMANEDIKTLTAAPKEKKYPHKRELKSLKSPRRMRQYGAIRSSM